MPQEFIGEVPEIFPSLGRVLAKGDIVEDDQISHPRLRPVKPKIEPEAKPPSKEPK